MADIGRFEDHIAGPVTTLALAHVFAHVAAEEYADRPGLMFVPADSGIGCKHLQCQPEAKERRRERDQQ
jgi:hypothetical protein